MHIAHSAVSQKHVTHVPHHCDTVTPRIQKYVEEKLNCFSCKELLFHCNKIQNKLYLRTKNTTWNKYLINLLLLQMNYKDSEHHTSTAF